MEEGDGEIIRQAGSIRMKPRRLVVLTVCTVLLIFGGYRILQSIQADHNIIFVYLYLVVIIVTILGATRIRGSRRYVLDHPRAVRIIGGTVGGAGILLLVGLVVAAANNARWAGSQFAIWAALAPAVLGFMIYRLPEIVTPKKEIVDFLSWIHK
jgi:hypothetical protein